MARYPAVQESVSQRGCSCELAVRRFNLPPRVAVRLGNVERVDRRMLPALSQTHAGELGGPLATPSVRPFGVRGFFFSSACSLCFVSVPWSNHSRTAPHCTTPTTAVADPTTLLWLTRSFFRTRIPLLFIPTVITVQVATTSPSNSNEQWQLAIVWQL